MHDILILSGVFLLFALPLSIMDVRKFRISLPLLLIACLALIFCRLFLLSQDLIPSLKNMAFALLSSFLIFFATRIFSGEGLGWGDVFFGMYASLYCGFYLNIVASVFAASLGLLYYLTLAIIQKFKKKKFILKPLFAIPFVPFITGGALLTYLLVIVARL